MNSYVQYEIISDFISDLIMNNFPSKKYLLVIDVINLILNHFPQFLVGALQIIQEVWGY